MPRTSKHAAPLAELLARLSVQSNLGSLATAYTLSRWLTRPSRGRPRRTPTDLGLLCEPLHCRTADHLRLSGWAVTPPRPRGTVALFHGHRKHREHMLGRIAFLTAAGFRCVAFDHRAHGESSGNCTSFGYHESRDVVAILDLIRDRWPGQPCAALGVSTGGAALCFAASVARRLDAVILESVYHDLAGVLQRRLGSRSSVWFEQVRRGVTWVTERRLGVRWQDVAPVQHIAGLEPCPVLVVAGTADRYASPIDAERLVERCGGEKWLVPGARHGDAFEVGDERYRLRVLDFLDQWIQR
jgi:alpha-beta hydrolase superfamily lysophospholipase